MILLIIPLGQLALGGISEKYLPPDNGVRQAQEEFDKTFPGFRTEPLTLVIENDNGQPVTDAQIAEVRNRAMQIPGFLDADDDPSKMWQERSYLDVSVQDQSVRVIQNGLENRNDARRRSRNCAPYPRPTRSACPLAAPPHWSRTAFTACSPSCR